MSINKEDNTTITDQIMHEQALGIGLASKHYTNEVAKIMAEQRKLDWKNVLEWSEMLLIK